MKQSLTSAPIPPTVNGAGAAPGRVVRFPRGRRPGWPWLGALVVLVLVVVGGLYATGRLTALQQRLLGQATAATYETATVAAGRIAQTVTATGPVAAVRTVALGFKASGKIADLRVEVGQTVREGEVLAVLDSADLTAALDQATANLTSAEASYAKARLGATAEERAAGEVALRNAARAAGDAAASAAASGASTAKDVESAQGSVAAAEQSLATARDALAAAQGQAEARLAADRLAVENARKALAAAEGIAATLPAIQKEQLDQARTALWSQQISRDATCSRPSGGQCEAARASVAAAETSVNQVVAQAAQTRKQNEQTLQQSRASLETAAASLASDEVQLAASITSADNAVKAAETALANSRTGAAKARAQAAASAQSAAQSVRTAEGQVDSSRASLAQTTAPARQEDLDIASAQVGNARVAVQTARNNLEAATLVAPMAGTVAAVNGALGQWVTGGAVNSTTTTSGFITLVTLDDLQVTAAVNEADIGKVKAGDPVAFTVSAFPGTAFAGRVTHVQPTGTTTSNVVTYAVTSSVTPAAGAALYPGMTATVTITTAERTDALLLPSRAVSFARTAVQQGLVAPAATGTGRNVVTLQDGQPSAAPVTTGLTDGTNTEVTAGLRAGQVVVTGQTGGATASTSASAGSTTGASTTQRTPTGQSSNPLTGGVPGGGPPGR